MEELSLVMHKGRIYEMAKQKVQKEEDVDIKVLNPNKETFVVRWFQDYAVNNKSELKIVCDLTSRSAEEQFQMYLDNGNTEVYAVVFYATFLSILEFIKEKQKRYNNFTVQIFNSVNIGYTNNDDDENEKVGNFMPIMEYISINRNIMDDGSPVTIDTTTTNFVRWQDLNIKKNGEYFKEIQEKAYDKLNNEYKTNLRTSEAVIPLFCIFLDNITNVLKMKYKEAEGTDVSEVNMNVLGLFDVYYSFNEEENLELYDYQPNILMKLALKSDNIASRD